MSHEARCPNCGCEFELSAEDVAAIVDAHAPAAPASDSGPKSSRFAFKPELVEQDGVQVVRISPAAPSKRRPASER